jgi:hypothetical protein
MVAIAGYLVFMLGVAWQAQIASSHSAPEMTGLDPGGSCSTFCNPIFPAHQVKTWSCPLVPDFVTGDASGDPVIVTGSKQPYPDCTLQ